MVIQAFDGQLFCIVNENTVLVLEEVPEYEKTSRAFAPEIPREKPKKRYIPPMSHPWRRSTFIRFGPMSILWTKKVERLCYSF